MVNGTDELANGTNTEFLDDHNLVIGHREPSLDEQLKQRMESLEGHIQVMQKFVSNTKGIDIIGPMVAPMTALTGATETRPTLPDKFVQQEKARTQREALRLVVN